MNMSTLNVWAILVAAVVAFMLGAVWFSPATFERRPWAYVLVNGGYLTVALVIMGAILGGWR